MSQIGVLQVRTRILLSDDGGQQHTRLVVVRSITCVREQAEAELKNFLQMNPQFRDFHTAEWTAREHIFLD